LAALGIGRVAPNPLVGSVIVHDNRIIGEGYHKDYGQAHAEVNAVNSVQEDDLPLLKESTIYVNLEPCAHHGKTPPCADLLVEKRFKRVVIACVDPFAKVNGLGIQKLEKANIEVIVGIREKEAAELNRRFFTFHEHKRPYVILKWAQTRDGFIDRDRKDGEVGVNWITGSAAQRLVHIWRAEEDAILVGYRTALHDNPSLTVRHVEGKHPLRIVIDQKLELPTELHLFDGASPTLVYTEQEIDAEHPSIVTINFDQFLPTLLADLHYRDVQSVIIEGGAATLGKFIDQNLWDEARVFNGQGLFESGLKAPLIDIPAETQHDIEGDQLDVYRNRK